MSSILINIPMNFARGIEKYTWKIDENSSLELYHYGSLVLNFQNIKFFLKTMKPLDNKLPFIISYLFYQPINIQLIIYVVYSNKNQSYFLLKENQYFILFCKILISVVYKAVKIIRVYNVLQDLVMMYLFKMIKSI